MDYEDRKNDVQGEEFTEEAVWADRSLGHERLCGLQQRRPIWADHGINKKKKHTADMHCGRYLSFVYHACSVHNRVGLVGKEMECRAI